MKPVRVAIFASGTGSNAMALIKKAQELGSSSVEVVFVLSDMEQAGVLAKAQAQGVLTFLREKKKDRSTHEQDILFLLKEHRIDWVLLAGYMRLLSSSFLEKFSSWHQGQSQIINIHPSLLPAYPGVGSIERAFQDQVPESGVTLHWVDAGMDTGPHLRQEKVIRSKDDTLETWSEKIHALEHQMYTSFLEDLSRQKIKTAYFQETP